MTVNELAVGMCSYRYYSEITGEAEEEDRPGEAGRDGGQQIDADGDGEEPATTEGVSQPPEHQRAQHRAQDVGAAGQADLGRGETKALGDRRRQRTNPGLLQPVQDPGDPQRGHD